MAGPLTIQRVPRGLIELLGMRATGETPSTMSQDIVGVIDISDAYLYDRLQFIRSSTAVAVTAMNNYGFQSMTVPSGFQWHVFGLSADVPATAAATACTLTLCINRGILNVRQAITDPIKLGATEGTMFGKTFEIPHVLNPGDSLSIYCSQVTGVPNTTPTGMLVYAAIGI